MRILVQDCDSDLYLTEGDKWIKEHEKALACQNTGTAFDATRRLRTSLFKSDMQIVLKFENAEHDIEIPVLGSDCD